MEIQVLTFRLLLACLLGGLIGFEREFHGREAGFRTHILVCLGSALFMVISFQMSHIYGHLGNVDPSRIASGIVTGVGFLGAGAILRDRGNIRGLTTASSIWASCAVGMSAGAGLYYAAVLTAIIVTLILFMSKLTGLSKRKHIKHREPKKDD